jgi:hypothetical protein
MERTHYIYVDFENVQLLDLGLIANRPVVLVLVLGEHNKELPVSLVKKLVEHVGQVRIAQSWQTGKNALDFVLACQVGLRAAEEPEAFFHVVSRDKGFDALVGHLKELGILAARHDAFADIPILAPVETMSPDELALAVKLRLARPAASRPKKRKALLNHIQTQFGRRLAPEKVDEIVRRLSAMKAIAINPEDLVTYAFDRLP